MMLKTLPDNPYIIGRPIWEPELFFGREDLFYFIEDNLKKEAKVILLHGQRRIGKSSILAQIPNCVKLEQFVFVSLSLEGKSQKPLYEVLYELAEDIRDYLLEKFSLTELAITLPDLSYFQENLDIFIQVFLPEVYQVLDNKNLVLLLDEFDILGESHSEAAIDHFFPYLQSILFKQSKLFIIPVIGRQVNDMPILLSLFKDAPNKQVGLLDKFYARQLIVKPTEGILTYQEEAVQTILDLTSGHPYMTQIVCFAIFGQARQLDRWQVTKEDVTQIIDQAIEYGEGGLAWFYDGLTIPERVFFSAIAEVQGNKTLNLWQFLKQHEIVQSKSKNQVSDNQYKTLFDMQWRLLEWQYIKREGQDYMVTIEMVRRWLLKRHSFVQTLRAYQVYLAQELLDSKFKVWSENKRRFRGLLNPQELLFVQKYKNEFNWRGELEKRTFVQRSQQLFYALCWGSVILFSVPPIFFLCLNYTKAGQLWQIRRDLTNWTEQVNDPESQVKAVTAFAKDGNLPQALNIANQIKEDYSKADALSAISEAYGKLNQPEEAAKLLKQALDSAKQIKEDYSKASALSAIAEAYGKLNQPQEAADLLKQALDSANQIQKDDSKAYALSAIAEALSAIAEAYGKLNQPQEAANLLKLALNITKQIQKDDYKASALSAISEAIGKLNQPEEAANLLKLALDSVNKIQDDYYKVYALSAIAEAYTKLNKPEEAKKLLSQAFELAAKIGYTSQKTNSLVSIAQAQANLKNWGEALTVTKECSTDPCHVESLAAVLTIHAEQQHPELKEDEEN